MGYKQGNKTNRISFVTVLIFSCILILSGCGNNIKKQIEKAVSDINSGNYIEAKNELDTILKEDSNNSEAILLNNIIVNYEEAKKLYENKEYNKANEKITKIPSEYSNYNIKNNIDDLKSNISKKLDEIKNIDENINELSKLIKAEKLNEASKKIDKFEHKDLTKEQKDKIKELKELLNKKIDNKKEIEKKAKEEKKKLEEERKKKVEQQNKIKEEKKNDTSNKATGSEKVEKNTKKQGNIHYVNEKFGIQMYLPANWRGKYYVSQSDDFITFCYRTPKNKNVVGTLLCIEKLRKDDENIMLDDAVIKNINGRKYVIGGPTDVGTNAYDLGEMGIYNEYRSLKKEKGLVYQSIKAIN